MDKLYDTNYTNQLIVGHNCYVATIQKDNRKYRDSTETKTLTHGVLKLACRLRMCFLN